ncbi:MAG TPA: hypothetical protein VFC03_17310 [Acidimicrobiales bacterium]|nr:hypothetical protein [Acidimicrobiales bacterium]
MEGVITDSDRAAMLRCAVVKVGRDELKAALDRASDPRFQAPKAVANALNALRKRPDPVAAVGRTQYRPALPYVAAVISDECLSKTIELLGEHSDDPTGDQLREALDKVRQSFSDVTIAVMLASVADGDMPASDLCFGVLAAEERYGLTDWSEGGDAPAGPERSPRESSAVTPEQREARRLKKQRDAEERRKKQEAARAAAEQVRRAKKKERSGASAEPGAGPAGAKAPAAGVAPRLTRRAALTPAQEEEFDRDDPSAAGVVFAWVPFDSVDPGRPGLDGKSRRCVVVAGSPTHLLVRPGYSQGGVKSRDWKSVPLSHWKQAGFDQPTWIDDEMLRVPRDPESSPVGRLSPEDWNALW